LCRAGWALLGTLTTHHALGQAAPEPSVIVRKAETTVTLDSPEPIAVLLQGASQIATPMSEEESSARLAKILKVKNTDERHELLAAFGIAMGETNPVRGFQMALTEFNHLHDTQTFGIPLLRHWAKADPQAALEACKQIPEGERRAMAYSATLSGWARVDPHAASEWVLENLSGIYRRTAIARIGKVWAATEPRQAAKWALTNSSEVDQVFSLSEVIDIWADDYGQNAAEWCANLPAGKLRDFALSKAVLKWADYFSQTAAEWLVAHPDDLWLLPRVIARWGQHAPEAANAWLDKNVNESSAQESRQAMVQEWAEYNPRVALEWVATALKGPSREVASSSALSQWASEYPQEALHFAARLADETERHNALASVFSAWCGQDLEDFSAWLKQQKPSIEKDIAIEQLADVLITTSPAAALSEVLTMQAPDRRQRALTLHYQNWKLTEPLAAEAWLKLHPEAAKFMSP
jgi:hypothetical protein